MPYSHHSHSGQFCKHAVGLLEDVVKEASRQGFEIYGLTEHAPRYRTRDLYPEEIDISVDVLMTTFEAFLDEAHRLRRAYSSSLRVLVGLETENISVLDTDGLSTLLDAHKGRIDYIVGSVHHVNGIPIDFDLDTYRRCLGSIPLPTHENEKLCIFLDMYFDAQFELLNKFHPELIGHIDLCRLYTPDLRLPAFPRAWDRLERNVKFAIAYGALFEVNAAAFRKGWGTAYPGHDIVELIILHGGRFALSDDSHGPHSVGLNYGQTRDYLLRVGVQELWTLECKDFPNPGGRYTGPVRTSGNWWDHAFWAGKRKNRV
ncbi:histidinol phosphate phosphatase H [Multifurca ochricompacta]|uniref:Histidinol-phosphatase n=1 Tax=Multifurca ochricompacta TaxID=376703 RepID=A0AAD4M2B0_9AGAM|nr:histidinol phosphate phosphatase H [Multifurca ochricompacta]